MLFWNRYIVYVDVSVGLSRHSCELKVIMWWFSWSVKLVSVIWIDNFQQFEDHICIYDLQQFHTIISLSFRHFILVCVWNYQTVCETGACSIFSQFFYSFVEQYVTLRFCRILNAFSKVPPKPKIPSAQRYLRYCANQLDTAQNRLLWFGVGPLQNLY